MSKVNILAIVIAHYRSVFDGSIAQILRDILVFAGFPLACSLFFHDKIGNVTPEIRNLLITVFSVFSALLFSAQIGLFALRRANDYSHLETIEKQVREEADDDFNEFLKSFSANTSYLILLSAISLVLFVIEIIADPTAQASGVSLWLDAAIIYLATHFFLTLMMVLKRFFVAYERSY